MPDELIVSRLSELDKKLEEIRAAVIKENRLFLGVSDAAKYLDVSISTIYALVHYNRIPFYKIPGGRKTYFAIEDLNLFVLDKKNRIKSIKEISDEVDHRLMIEKINS
jgi:excisionase family DNA binding protein